MQTELLWKLVIARTFRVDWKRLGVGRGDRYHDSYKGALGDGSAWLGFDISGRMLRGGAWISGPASVRSANSSRDFTDIRNFAIGFRLAQDR